MSLSLQPTLFDLPRMTDMNARQIHILRSPNHHGSSARDAQPYLDELGISILDNPQPIQFFRNNNEAIHRWSPYVQGFSSQFVQRMLERFAPEYHQPLVLDPFAGSGTVMIQAKLNGFPSVGIELNPLLHFIAQTKLEAWGVSPDRLRTVVEGLNPRVKYKAPDFLESERQFNPGVLRNLEILKASIDSFEPYNEEDQQIKNLLLVAFAAILIDCSNLKRTPCLGYSPHKQVEDQTPFTLFNRKIREICEDLTFIHTFHARDMSVPAQIILGNSIYYEHPQLYDLVITSPPYMNGLDYVINYKIEMGWLGFGRDHRDLKRLKDEMVVCDNVSKGLIRRFSQTEHRYTNPWLEDIKTRIRENIQRRGAYRRQDMPEIVHKYFDDMYRVMQRVTQALKPNGRFILVVGDSLIADVYVPTDLILARMGRELGLVIEAVEKARNRRSGQIRSYQLRESIVILKKE
jgi:DNA modification methylase